MSNTKNERKGNTLADIPENVAIAQLEHYGEKLVIPEGMTLPMAKELIERREKYLEEDMNFNEVFAYFPYDGANALNIVLERTFGWSCAEPTPGMFGDRPPALVNIEVAPGVFKKVPWGRFSLPGMEGGWIQCAAAWDGSGVKFALTGIIKRKYEDQVDKLFAEVRKELNTNSIYRGKAVKIRFKDDDGDDLDMPVPEFMDLSDVDEQMLIYSDTVQEEISINLFTPIERVHDCILSGIPIKRGVMLAGKYGTGKTLGAKVAAKKAVATGNTFVYIPHADELSKAIEFAKQYQSPACVVFCEDIDRALNGERTVEMDDILNIIDGIDTKSCNIITILTTNDIEAINPTMLRPGRLDAIIEVTPPDAKAVARLLRAYAGDTIDATVSLDKAAALLAGNIPAVIAEVVKRAKLAQLTLTPVGEAVKGLSEVAIIKAANSIKAHVELLDRRSADKTPKLPALEQTFAELVRYALTGDARKLATIVAVKAPEYQTN